MNIKSLIHPYKLYKVHLVYQLYQLYQIILGQKLIGAQRPTGVTLGFERRGEEDAASLNPLPTTHYPLLTNPLSLCKSRASPVQV